MGKKLYRTRQNVTKSGGSGGATLKKFTAPTPGLEDVFFTWGTAKDAAKFEDTVSQLANYVGTRNWIKSSASASNHGVILTFVFNSHHFFVTFHPFYSTSPAPDLML